MAKLSGNWSGSGGNADAATSVAGDHLKVQYNAVKMLRDRVRIIRDYVVDTKEGRIPWNHEILREAHNLSNRLPLVQSNTFRQEFFNQCNDVALMTYLGMITKGTQSMNQFVTKFGTLYDRQGMGRVGRMRPPFY
jgi:COP9 signalosome complex subunit 6